MIPPLSHGRAPRRARVALAAAAMAVVSAITLAGCSGSSAPKGGEDATVRVGLVLEPTSLDIRTQSGAALDHDDHRDESR